MEQCVCKLRWHLACRSSLPSNWRLMTFKLGGTCVPRSRFGRRVAVSNRAFAKTLLPISRLSRRNFSRKVYGPSFFLERDSVRGWGLESCFWVVFSVITCRVIWQQEVVL